MGAKVGGRRNGGRIGDRLGTFISPEGSSRLVEEKVDSANEILESILLSC
jgi:hypothetical protein